MVLYWPKSKECITIIAPETWSWLVSTSTVHIKANWFSISNLICFIYGLVLAPDSQSWVFGSPTLALNPCWRWTNAYARTHIQLPSYKAHSLMAPGKNLGQVWWLSLLLVFIATVYKLVYLLICWAPLAEPGQFPGLRGQKPSHRLHRVLEISFPSTILSYCLVVQALSGLVYVTRFLHRPPCLGSQHHHAAYQPFLPT